jgi:hypothetical protein
MPKWKKEKLNCNKWYAVSMYVAVYIAYILYFKQDTNTDINYCTSTSH